MAKIIKIAGDEVTIAAENAREIYVKNSTLNFVPNIGDEVDVYEENGIVSVSKKTNIDLNTPVNAALNNTNLNENVPVTNIKQEIGLGANYVYNPNVNSNLNQNTNLNSVTNTDQANNTINNGNLTMNTNQALNEGNPQAVQYNVIYEVGHNNINTMLYVVIILSIFACFLPVISISYMGYSFSINCVYYDGHIAEGAIIVGIQFLALILLFLRKSKFVAILELIIVILLCYALFRVFKDVSSFKQISSMFQLFGVGFYLLVITTIIAPILAFKNSKNA